MSNEHRSQDSVWNGMAEDNGDEEFGGHQDVLLDRKCLLETLDDIGHLCLSDEAGDLEAARESLDQALHNLRLLYGKSVYWDSEDVRSEFFRAAKKRLQKISQNRRRRSELTNTISKFQTAMSEERLRPHQLAPAGQLTYPWTRMCSNRIPLPSKPTLQKAYDENSTLLILEQYLPRGGVLIINQWREEVNLVVGDLLNTVNDQARKTVIDKQKANYQSIYTLRRKVQGLHEETIEPEIWPVTKKELVSNTASSVMTFG
ncbi:hypothetical protein LTR56_014743 [Elasticomyces elasticus]|nr:hypothetical protein LTR56_014743 [Elasticomyces elasticus]KAK3645459.1 hypothetical protein LTR22_014721 [Elasticomyces elasticus]KAK4915815.1 hypothetical protein LTR49_016073 [Elasticomyces elasticus]KAK5755589.1 hypothetical protein LTS12_014345 [Elasticomyces elasticus]